MGKSIDAREFFVADNFKALNGPDYNPADPRTYKMSPLARTPFEDVLIHLSVPKTPGGGVLVRTNQGAFTGDQYSQTIDKAYRCLLHFPKASDVDISKGVVKIETILLPSFLPSWMIARYGLENLGKGLWIRHQVPLFLDKRTKDFVCFLDEGLLDEIDPKSLLQGVDESCVRLYNGKERNKRYLALVTKDFEHLRHLGSSSKKDNPLTEAFWQIKENYTRLSLDADKLEKVIVIKCEKNNSDHSLTKWTDVDAILKTGTSLSFGLAARHNNNYYWIDQEGNVNTRVGGSVYRGHADKTKLSMGGKGLPDETIWESTIVIPYTEKDWESLLKIQVRLREVQDALTTLIKGCEGNENSENDLSLEQSILKLESTRLLGVDSGSKKNTENE